MQLTIEKLVYGGDGLARLAADEHGHGKAVFVPFVLPGEQVEAEIIEDKTGFSRARSESILSPSERRTRPLCPYFQSCGGCHYQHAGYEYQLENKALILKENLRRIAKLELDRELKVHPSPPWNYRNRTRLKIQAEPAFAVGYYKFGSHELLPVQECPISSPLINRAIGALWQMNRAVSGLRQIELFSDAEDTQALVELDCIPEAQVSEVEQWAREFQRTLPEIAGVGIFRALATRATTEPKRIAAIGAESLRYKTASVSFRVSAGAFFQVNRHLIEGLVDLVTHGRSGTLALDLYAGVGLFSTMLARSFAQVVAVESSPISHSDLLYNSPPNVKALRVTTEQYLEKAAGKLRPDFVVVDPPRSGLGARVLRQLLDLGTPRITYVSCDPATLARDLRGLLDGGYRMEEAHLVDLFPQTYHLESAVQLVR